MPHREPSVPPASAFQSARQQSGTALDPETDADRAPSRSPGSMLVWARSGPAAAIQARWTAALARGMEKEATLMDVVETPWSLAPSQAETALQDRVLDRLGTLRRRAQSELRDVPADLQVRLTRSAERNVVDSAKSERRDPIVLWAPVREWVIRAILRATDCTVLVIRAPVDPPELPWVGVADGDRLALSVARALIRGSQTDLSLRQVPRLDPERVDDVPCRVACVSRPTPGWIGSHILRRRRTAPATDGGIVEVYSNGTRVV